MVPETPLPFKEGAPKERGGYALRIEASYRVTLKA